MRQFKAKREELDPPAVAGKFSSKYNPKREYDTVFIKIRLFLCSRWFDFEQETKLTLHEIENHL